MTKQLLSQEQLDTEANNAGRVLNRDLERSQDVKELIKLGSQMKRWPWPKLGYLLAVVLLVEHVVTFDQAIVLVLLAWIADSIGSDRKKTSLPK